MNTPHTPGPWNAETNRSPLTITRELARLPKTQGGHRQFREIGEVYVTDKGDGAPEDFANAQLIAAAPELLAALRCLLARANSLDQSATQEGLQNCDAIASARAAIAKATGNT